MGPVPPSNVSGTIPLLNEREETHRIYQRLLKLPLAEDEKPFVQWLAAESLFAEGKMTDAFPYYFSVLNSHFRERALFQIGKGYFFENQFREGLINFDLLFLEFPNLKSLDEGLFIKGGDVCSVLAKPSGPWRLYGQLSIPPRTNPWQLMALTQIGVVSLSLEEYERAEDVFKRILEDFPNHPLFYHAAFHLGNLYGEKGDFPKASQFYALVLKGL